MKHFKLRKDEEGYYLLESEDAKEWHKDKHFKDSDEAIYYAFTNGILIRER